MSSDSGPVNGGLEQSCQRPGHWLIEGYDVKRTQHFQEAVWNDGRSHKTWWTWRITKPGRYYSEHRTLAEARDWIASQ